MALQVTSPSRFYGIIFAIIIIGAVVALFFAWGDGDLQKSGPFTIEQGTASRQVWRDLEAEGFTSRTLPWKYYSWRQEAADKIQAGTYELIEGEKVKDVMRRFVAGDTQQDELSLTFPEGFTLDQIAERTAARGIGTKEEFVTIASNPQQFAEEFPFLASIPAGRTLEGYLFPDTYRVFIDDTPTDVIRRMLGAFQERAISIGLIGGPTGTRTIDEVVIMASIVEREVQTDEDMAMVAGVLWKRFDDGVGLDADATVRYAVGKQREALTVQDLAVESPYNTRRYRGLPPGPISSPGLRALTATLNPEESEFYYYLSAPSGETIFSRDLDEHNVNKAKYLQ